MVFLLPIIMLFNANVAIIRLDALFLSSFSDAGIEFSTKQKKFRVILPYLFAFYHLAYYLCIGNRDE